jgi:inosine-uridine nucleoside N-ribohydrolase
MTRYLFLSWGVAMALMLTPGETSAREPAQADRAPLVVDTDIGSDIDDAFALALVLASPELDLRGVTTVSGDTRTRALIACRMLTAAGRRDVPVAAGAAPQPEQALSGQQQYAQHPAVIFHRTSQPVREAAHDFLYRRLKEQPGRLTLLALGPLTNVARLLREHPDCKPWIRRIVLMAGSVHVGYKGKPPAEVEWNVRLDIPAAKAVFASGVPLVVAPLDATSILQLEAARRQHLFAAQTPLTYQIQSLYQMADHPTPTLFDPVAAALCFGERFCRLEQLHLEVDAAGMTRITRGKANAQVAVGIERDPFLDWYVDRVASFGKPARPRPPGNVSHTVERGRLPVRVHAWEDFETDIEKRWWMSGRLETANVPAGSKRACRGILTEDFDDLMGDLQALYTAVIFNPVPGPPLGKSPRLTFRYWLAGSDTLRVQLYSLSKGYHRYLSLTGLPQKKWQEATVDMTAARRPDGSGGPFAEGERIDDIQFYADPSAELLIDDIVLYEAAGTTEKRPFPRRILYTGWFDTGKQGKEWPGDFTIVTAAPGMAGKAAQSIIDPGAKKPWLRLDLRGQRPLGETTHLRFRYHLKGADSLEVELRSHGQKDHQRVDVTELRQGQWSEATVVFPARPRGGVVEEIVFLLRSGAELQVDDVLLYER